MSVSIVMPVYNEKLVIESVIRDYYGCVLSRLADSELIVIDDHSTDGTQEILKRLKNEYSNLRVIRADINNGHGKSIRSGYEAAEKDWVFQVDSDNQFDAQDFWKLYEYIDRYDIIIGLRKTRHDPIYRIILTKIIRIVNFILFNVWIRDANCPFRLMKKTVLINLLNSIDKDAIAPNIFITILARKLGLVVKEVSVKHTERKAGPASLVNLKLIRFSFHGLMQLISFRRKLGSMKL